MHSGVEAANLLHTALRRGTDAAADLARYERRFRKAMHRYWHLVELFYTQPFMELFFSPRERFHLASAVNAILAGELRGGWKLQWRLTLFFLLVRLQRRYPLVPHARLNSQEPA